MKKKIFSCPTPEIHIEGQKLVSSDALAVEVDIVDIVDIVGIIDTVDIFSNLEQCYALIEAISKTLVT